MSWAKRSFISIAVVDFVFVRFAIETLPFSWMKRARLDGAAEGSALLIRCKKNIFGWWNAGDDDVCEKTWSRLPGPSSLRCSQRLLSLSFLFWPTAWLETPRVPSPRPKTSASKTQLVFFPLHLHLLINGNRSFAFSWRSLQRIANAVFGA